MLNLQPDNPKALFRRGQARLLLKVRTSGMDFHDFCWSDGLGTMSMQSA